MSTRRQFITRGAAAAVVAALSPRDATAHAPAASAGPMPGAAPDARARKLHAELRRYATMAAVAQSAPAPDG